MCFTVLKELPYPVKLSFDLEVVKYGSDISKGLDGSVYFHSYHTSFIYSKNILSPTVFIKKERGDKGLYKINEGYYSFYRYVNAYHKRGDEKIVGIFLIPQDTPFYIDNCGVIVSESIRFVDLFSKKNLKKYKQLELIGGRRELIIQNKVVVQKLEEIGINIDY